MTYGNIDGERSADALDIVACHYFSTRRFERAYVEAVKALGLRRSIVEKITGKSVSGPTNTDADNNEKALGVTIDTQILFKDANGRTFLDKLADAYYNVGMIARIRGKTLIGLQFLEAAMSCKLMLDIRDKAKASSNIQNIVLNFGLIHHQMSNFSPALEAYKDVLAHHKRVLGSHHAKTIALQQLISQLHNDMSNFLVRQRSLDQPTSDSKVTGEDPKIPSKDLKIEPRRRIAWNDKVSRVQALYSGEASMLTVPSCRIQQQFTIDSTFKHNADIDVLAFAAVTDALRFQMDDENIMKLPVVNVPFMNEEGKGKRPVMALNPEAKKLFSKWNVRPPAVEPKGEVGDIKGPQDAIPKVLPLWDKLKNSIVKGYDGTPVYVPNPALATNDVSIEPIHTPPDNHREKPEVDSVPLKIAEGKSTPKEKSFAKGNMATNAGSLKEPVVGKAPPAKKLPLNLNKEPIVGGVAEARSDAKATQANEGIPKDEALQKSPERQTAIPGNGSPKQDITRKDSSGLVGKDSSKQALMRKKSGSEGEALVKELLPELVVKTGKKKVIVAPLKPPAPKPKSSLVDILGVPLKPKQMGKTKPPHGLPLKKKIVSD
eukprot:Lankesteria_metandrocarpae@DN6042_c0_g1_i1.p1